jgi:SMI1 / KNR4 family (SUKH-1)
MVTFVNSAAPIRAEDIASVERELGIHFPVGLRNHFLETNGGSPEPYIYEDGSVISQCLVLVGRGSAVDAYRDLALKKRVFPLQFFPFAVEGGGDLFLVDCSTPDGMVYLWRHDLSAETLVSLHSRIDDFWSRVTDDAPRGS